MTGPIHPLWWLLDMDVVVRPATVVSVKPPAVVVVAFVAAVVATSATVVVVTSVSSSVGASARPECQHNGESAARDESLLLHGWDSNQ